MPSRHQMDALRLLLILAPAALAQTSPTSATDHTATTPTRTSAPHLGPSFASFSFFSASSSFPSSNDNAPKNKNDNNNLHSDGFVQYYFVFLALFVCCFGLAIFFTIRRRAKNRARRRRSDGRESALQRDLNRPSGWPGSSREAALGQRRYYRRDADVTGEEGLNEHGEAPPPYIPKRQSEERQRGEGEASDGPTIPLQTLSRDQVGVKPPDYTESSTYEVQANARDSGTSAGSSRNPDPSTSS